MEKKIDPKKISMKNTKEEMLEAYSYVLKQLQEKKDNELRPEKKLEEKKIAETLKTAESLTTEGVAHDLNNLKIDIGKTLTSISDSLESQVTKLNTLQAAVSAKESEIKELYEIEKSAVTLAALIETQNLKKQEFLEEMEKKKEILVAEINTLRGQWDKEQDEHDALFKERDTAEAKRRAREKEEFDYAFKKEQQLLKDKAKYENDKWENEVKLKKEMAEKELKTRELAIAAKEEELAQLRKSAAAFPKELELSIGKSVKETSEKILMEAKNREELLKKQFEGEINVFKARNESLEKTVKEQNERISFLSQQLEYAYQKVQDIAVKTVEGSSSIKSIASLLGDQLRKQSAEK